MALLVLLVAPSGCSRRSGTAPSLAPSPPATAVTGVTVSGEPPRLGGAPVPFTATARFSDGTTSTVTGQAAWQSSDTSVASVTAAGLVGAVGPGVTEIRATYRAITGSLTTAVEAVPVHDTLVAPGAQSYPGGYSSQQTYVYPPGYSVWDDFTPTFSTRVNAIAWQGIYCRLSYPYDPSNPVPDATEFRLSFYADAGPFPGAMIGEELRFPRLLVNERLEANVPGSCVDEGHGTSGLYSYEVTLPTPFAVVARTRYWINIRAYYAQPGPLGWLWRYGAADNGRSYLDIAGLIASHDLAFALR